MSETKIIESSPSINKVLLIENGRGGLKVKYHLGQTINGVESEKERQEKVVRPVQKEIRDCFAKLKQHLLRGCSYHWENDNVRKMLIAKTVVTSILTDKHGQIQVSGYTISGGTHHAAMSTPFLSSEYYPEFKDLDGLRDTIFEEAKLFMNGTKSATVKQVVVDYMFIKKDIADADAAYNKLTPAEIEAITKEAMEDSGLMIVKENGIDVIVPAEEKEKPSLISEAVLADVKSNYDEDVINEEPFIDPTTPDNVDVANDDFVDFN